MFAKTYIYVVYDINCTVFWGHVDYNSQNGVEHFKSPAFFKYCEQVIDLFFPILFTRRFYIRLSTV